MSLLEDRKRAIESCIEWAEGFGRQRNVDDAIDANSPYRHIMKLDKISFDPMDDGQMIGVFAREKIRKGEIILTIPQECVLGESHNPLLQEIASGCVDQAMKLYRENISTKWKQSQAKMNPWSPFYKTQGRVLLEDELRLGLHVTLLLFVHRLSKRQDVTLSGGPLKDASAHFGRYFDTLPQRYESLLFRWTSAEIDMLKGTSCHSLAQRLRAEVQENWDDSFQEVLVDYLKKQLAEGGQDELIDRNLLYESYMDAICTIYSRMHALEVVGSTTVVTAQNNTRCTCPLVDLVNGDREESPRCNTHLLHYPDIHVALQATRDIETGEELVFSYGQVSNQVFVSKFGFLPLRNNTANNKRGPGYPQMIVLDVVHVLPPPQMVWEESDPRWKSLISERDGKTLERWHLLDTASSTDGTPFALLGDAWTMGKVRGSETWRPHYLNNFHLYAMLSLTTDGEEEIIEPWEPGAIIMDMIDYRLDQLPTISIKRWEALLAAMPPDTGGNKKTAIRYQMLERESLTMWRHAIALQYDVYGENSTFSSGKTFEPLLPDKSGCCVCQTALAGPLKSCTRCKSVYYCGRTCQIADWKSGHKEACKSSKKDTRFS